MTTGGEFAERFDAEVAAGMQGFNAQGGGLVRLLGLEIVAVGPGTMTARALLSDELVTPSGNVHGGALASILDHITGPVVYPLIPRGYWGATTELKLNYIRPVGPGLVDGHATVLAMTNRSAVVRGELRVDDRVVCAAQGTIAIVPPRPS